MNAEEMDPKSSVLDFSEVVISAGRRKIISCPELTIQPDTVTAIIGPSGCGKSTLFRAALRLIDPKTLKVEGRITAGRLDALRLSGRSLQEVRRRIAFVSQVPTSFPMSIYDNICLGLRYWHVPRPWDDLVEKGLRQVALWDVAKVKLGSRHLSPGQLQRLAIARALVLDPAILILDEPFAFIDPTALLRLEDLVHELKYDGVGSVIVTHDMHSAARVSDWTVVLGFDRGPEDAEPYGVVIEQGPTEKIFTNPDSPITEGFVTGRFE